MSGDCICMFQFDELVFCDRFIFCSVFSQSSAHRFIANNNNVNTSTRNNNNNKKRTTQYPNSFATRFDSPQPCRSPEVKWAAIEKIYKWETKKKKQKKFNRNAFCVSNKFTCISLAINHFVQLYIPEVVMELAGMTTATVAGSSNKFLDKCLFMYDWTDCNSMDSTCHTMAMHTHTNRA